MWLCSLKKDCIRGTRKEKSKASWFITLSQYLATPVAYGNSSRALSNNSGRRGVVAVVAPDRPGSIGTMRGSHFLLNLTQHTCKSENHNVLVERIQNNAS